MVRFLLYMSKTYPTFRKESARDLLAHLERTVRERRLRSGTQLGTELALAEQYGISRMTVRRAVDYLVAEGLIERRAGQGLFATGKVASGLLVQVVVPVLASSDQCTKVARGAMEHGDGHGCEVLIRDCGGELGEELGFMQELPQSNSEGAIIVSLHHPRFAQSIFAIQQTGYPMVLVDDQPEYVEVSTVIADNYGGGYRVGEEFVRLGHRRVGFVGCLQHLTARQRFEGMRDAMLDAGLPFDRSLTANLDIRGGVFDKSAAPLQGDALGELMTAPGRPTALFFSDDARAQIAYHQLAALGIKVPGDVSVVGFDNSEVCEQVHPPLASVEQPSFEMGRQAMEMLLRHIRDPDMPAEHRVLPTRWTPRESLGKPAA